jgi:basic amino acid/polyamine antiporter, APA family
VMLVMMLGQTRVFFAMAKDGLLPWFDKCHHTYRTPSTATVVTMIFVAICGGLMPMSLVGELVSIGTLLAFVLVCAGVVILRIRHPEISRPFRVPFFWFVAPAGIASCVWVMTGLPHDTWLRLIVWLAVGFVLYFAYGYKHSKLRAN